MSRLYQFNLICLPQRTMMLSLKLCGRGAADGQARPHGLLARHRKFENGDISMRNRRLIQTGILAAAIAVACLGVSAGTAHAETIFTNLGPGGTFSTGVAQVVAASSDNGQVDGMSFTAGTTGDLTDAMLGVGHFGFDNAALTVDVESDDSGQPGAILATLAQQGTIPPDLSPGLVTFDCSGACPQLASGTPYWLVAVDTAPAKSVQSWFFSNNDVGTAAFNFSASATGPWTIQTGQDISAFEIDGTTPTTVPEPASWLLFATGLLGLGTLLLFGKRLGLRRVWG